MPEGNLIPLLYHLKNPRFHLIPFPGPPEEGQSRTDLVVLKAIRLMLGLEVDLRVFDSDLFLYKTYLSC